MTIQFQIQKIFKKECYLENFLQLFGNEEDPNDRINSFMDGNSWKARRKTSESILIPFFLYTDDFETNNVLGSHSGTQNITAFY